MSVLGTVVGWLAPPECLACGAEGETLCSSCAISVIVPFGSRCFDCAALTPNARTCERCRPGAPSSVWITTNYDDVAQDLIHKFKLGQQRVAAEPISRLMAATYLSFAQQNDALQSQGYLVVPVPTAASRIRQRGFDHADLLARSVARRLNLPCSKALRRVGSERQLGTNRTKRLAQQEGKYMVYKRELIVGRNILLVDDVTTTGATLRVATKVLRAAGAKHVDALVFAKRL